MTQISLSNQDLNAALQRCEDEPIHIPGAIQSCGALLGVARDTWSICYASETADMLGAAPDALMGRPIDDLLERETIHALRNAASKPSIKTGRHPVGQAVLNGRAFHLSLSPSDAVWVLEFEPVSQDNETLLALNTSYGFLMRAVQTAPDTQKLMETLVTHLSHLSGYDRVMVYRFDADWNGEVIAERVFGPLEPFLGLRFPKWDIPAQARGFMQRFPVRYIHDAADEPGARLLAQDPGLPPLDITYAQLRASSPIHLQYLRNMGVAGTMTMSLAVDSKLWGIVSFHHQKPRMPAYALRQICEALAPLVNTKLQALEQAEMLALHDEIDALQVEPGPMAASAGPLNDASEAMAAVQARLGVDAAMMGVGDEVSGRGDVLPLEAVELIRAAARAAPGGIWHSDSLLRDLPEAAALAGPICGALCVEYPDGRWICLMRRARTDGITWAGAPNKEVDTSDGMARLHPRGSFSLYTETVKDTSDPWQKYELRLLQGLAMSLLAANQRKLVLSMIRRQQMLVVDELNHRVRNILALVRSISRQARKKDSSLDSYTKALEQRINALAVAHDLGSANAAAPVALHDIIRLEVAPHTEEDEQRVVVSGTERGIVAEAAPIFALVIHELITNAAKYGALSVPKGQVIISLRPSEIGIKVFWIELGGPEVRNPNRRGFGTNLIEQAVPYELGGTSSLQFGPTGVTAELDLPNTILTDREVAIAKPRGPVAQAEPRALPQIGEEQTVLVVEDNYMIAVDLIESLAGLGLKDAELAAGHEQAMQLLETRDIAFAILDINLGRGGTSLALARALREQGTPFFFISGYGDAAPLPADFGAVLKLQKPISIRDLEGAVAAVLSPGEQASARHRSRSN